MPWSSQRAIHETLANPVSLPDAQIFEDDLMPTKEERLGLIKFCIGKMGYARMYLEVKDNEILALATTNGRATMHEIGYCAPPWRK